MPHKIVAHLHMVDPLAIMVLKDAENIIKDLVGKSLKWTQVDYFKPGPDLAAAVHQAIDSNPKVDILFLKNHGIVIGGDSIAAIEAIIEALSSSLKRGVVNECALGPSVLSLREIPEAYRQIYSYIDDSDVQSLVLESKYFHRVVNDWALYPDHVVFLGPKAFIYDSWVDFLKRENVETLPDLIFIKNIGVLALKSFSKAKYAQILNFFDVISRLSEEDVARPLSKSQVDELLNWDAEKYRLGLQKK